MIGRDQTIIQTTMITIGTKITKEAEEADSAIPGVVLVTSRTGPKGRKEILIVKETEIEMAIWTMMVVVTLAEEDFLEVEAEEGETDVQSGIKVSRLK